jgi:hypothetical protein
VVGVVVAGTTMVMMVGQVEEVLVKAAPGTLAVERVYLEKAIMGVLVQVMQVHTVPVGVVVQVRWVATVYKVELLVMVVSVFNQVFRVQQRIMRVAAVVLRRHRLLYLRVARVVVV